MRHYLAAAAGMCVIGLAQAQWNDDAKQCAELSGNPDLQIKHCTKAISSGQLSGPNMAVTLSNRGGAWLVKEDLPHALEDFTAALKVDAKLASAQLGRGQVNFAQGRYNLAALDLEQAQRLEPDAYATIWLYLARARDGKDGNAELATNVKALKGDKWPMPVIGLLSGKLTVEAATAKARDANAKTELSQQCEANFYIGEWLLTKKDLKQASARLQQAVAKCPKTFVEYVTAAAEAKRLK
jgi:lipoprotein NlpI